MNGMKQQQDQQTVQIAGFIQNFKTVPTRTGKPMAIFTLGNIPTKCFDLTVSSAEAGASMGTKIVVTGHFSNHQGKTELVADGIAPVALGKGHADVQTAFSHTGYPEKSVQRQVSTRETSMITEDLSGCVSNVKVVTTHSGRLMTTFKIGNASCKAFGNLASEIQKTEGKQIEVSARKGGFQGGTEYAIEIVKTIDGVLVDLRDGRTTTPGQHISKKVETHEATNQLAEMEAYEQFLQREIESDRWINKVENPPIHNQQDQPALTSDLAPSQQTLTAINTEPKEVHSNAESIQAATQSTTSAKSLSEPESLVDQWARRFRNSSFPDHELEDKFKLGLPYVEEAARRVLEERARQRAEACRTEN
jgi:hypothetical protein